MTPIVLLITSDLMTAAPIERAASLAGGECRVVAPSKASHLDGDLDYRLVLIDLEAVPAIASLVAAIQSTVGSQVPLVAFGPHVHANRLAEAQAAGCTQVLTRGQLHRDTQQIVAESVQANHHES